MPNIQYDFKSSSDISTQKNLLSLFKFKLVSDICWLLFSLWGRSSPTEWQLKGAHLNISLALPFQRYYFISYFITSIPHLLCPFKDIILSHNLSSQYLFFQLGVIQGWKLQAKTFLYCGQTTLSSYTPASQRERQLLCYSKVFSLSMTTFLDILSRTTKREK